MKRQLVLFLLMLVLALPASPATMRMLTLQQLKDASDAIVVARVLTVRSAWEHGSAQMGTITRIRVLNYITPSAAGEARELNLHHPGGRGRGPDGKMWQVHVPGAPVFKAKTKVFLFLRKKDARYWELVGWVQGFFRVQPSATGQEIVVRDLEGAEFINDVAQPVPNQITLNHMIAMVRRPGK
jgi:hypothetical protein